MKYKTNNLIYIICSIILSICTIIIFFYELYIDFNILVIIGGTIILFQTILDIRMINNEKEMVKIEIDNFRSKK